MEGLEYQPIILSRYYSKQIIEEILALKLKETKPIIQITILLILVVGKNLRNIYLQTLISHSPLSIRIYCLRPRYDWLSL